MKHDQSTGGEENNELLSSVGVKWRSDAQIRLHALFAFRVSQD
jgi:hypothetical protein